MSEQPEQPEQPRIIKPGVPLPLPTALCGSCGCIFSFSEKEKYLSRYINADFYAVYCPMQGCGRRVCVSGLF